MTTLQRLGAGDLRRAVITYRDLLRAHQESINRLNVYPVPDGDTGTNMALTLESVVAELGELGDVAGSTEPDMAAVAKAMSHGSLMGARGNSGVILSQILRGLAKTFEPADAADGPLVAAALEAASEAAYGAVMRPVEGTILTVGKAAADGAASAQQDMLVDVLDAAKRAADEALARTPEQLPVLKQAGVVDAGGAGFILLIDALLHVAAQRPLPQPAAPSTSTGTAAAEDGLAIRTEGEAIGDLRYEVMYFLEAADQSIPAFKDVWAGIGDSIVVVGGDGIWNCHIHTDDIGAAIEAALDAGRPRNIRVTDLFEQVEEERWVREATASASSDDEAGSGETVATAVVAVATGDGLRRIFRSLGVHQVVAGGQSMNPSTAQILDAVERVPAGEVVVLPNNKNIVPVAEQVDGLTAKTVRVVKTHGIAEGFAALLEYDPEATADENQRTMSEAAERVVAGEVTQAVRPSSSPAGPIDEGDYMGLSRTGIEVVAPTLDEATTGLLAKLLTDDHEIVTIIEGEGSGAAHTRRITEWLAEQHPAVTAEVHHGGQPLYPYLFSIE